MKKLAIAAIIMTALAVASAYAGIAGSDPRPKQGMHCILSFGPGGTNPMPCPPDPNHCPKKLKS